nr:hypothetical protein [Kibdelosporangium sp. MJ126-NF4]CTQ92542.1 hypothetical protein [Kibdelosporangium sp. MJ126-NF4]
MPVWPGQRQTYPCSQGFWGSGFALTVRYSPFHRDMNRLDVTARL